MNDSAKSKLIQDILIFGGLTAATSAIGGLSTITSVGEWYQTIEKPLLNPPDWVFSPVWFTLYVLMAVGIVVTLRAAEISERKKIQNIYLAQLAVNAFWPFAFFALESPLFGLTVIVPLVGLVFYMIRQYWPISRMGAGLMLPYLAWICFATYLNTAIVIIN